MDQYTKGEWGIKPMPLTRQPAIYAGNRLIAEMRQGDNMPNAEFTANARLITQAPKLYEALMRLMEALEKHGSVHNDIRIAYNLAKPVIANVEGDNEVKSIEDKVEQVIRNIQRRKYSRIVGDYANAGVDLFNENQLAWDLGIQPSQLEGIIPIKRTTPIIGSKGIMFAPSPGELREAIPKIKALVEGGK